MKKICLILGLLCIPTFAEATTVLYLGNSGSSLLSTVPAAGMDSYYKCSSGTTVTWSGCQTTAIEITYETQTGGAGTSSNPYILTGCNFVGCACGAKEYLPAADAKSCAPCSANYGDNSYASTTTTGNGQYHRLATCAYCGPDSYRGTSGCYSCPDSGTKAGVNDDDITSCCLDLNASQTDIRGTYTCSSKMCHMPHRLQDVETPTTRP